MKKAIALFLAAMMVFSLCACGKTEEAPAAPATEAPAAQAPAETAAPVETEAPVEIKGEVNIYTTMNDNACLELEDLITSHYPDLKANILKMNGGEMLSRVEAEAANPQADIVIGGSCDGYIGLAAKGLLQPYQPANAENFAAHTHDEEWNWVSHYQSYLGIYADKDWCEANNVEVPDSWADLLDPAFEGQIIVTNPGTSTTGYMFLSTMIAVMGEEEALKYFGELDKNIKSYASGGSGPSQSVSLGEAAIGVGYMQHGLRLVDQGFTNMVVCAPSEGTGLEISASGIIKDCKNPDNAKAVSDIICSVEYAELNREDNVGIMTSCGIAGPYFEDYADTKVADVDYGWAADNKDRLISAWDEVTSEK